MLDAIIETAGHRKFITCYISNSGWIATVEHKLVDLVTHAKQRVG